MPRDDEVMIENATLIFRNFSGREDQYNREGDRNFCILLEKETADLLEKSGWNVKQLRVRDEDEGGEPRDYIQVAVSYRIKDPRIVMLTSKGRNPIDESMVEMLDWVDIDTVDLVLRARAWEANGRSGIKAYLKTMYIKIVEDPLDLKYADYGETDGPED